MLPLLVSHLRYSGRMLRKSLGLTAAILVNLALGIGVTTAVYTIVYATLIAPLPYPDPQQLMMLWSRVNGGRNSISAGDFLDWKRQSQSFGQMAAWTGESYALTSGGEPEHIRGRLVTPGYFNLQGFTFFKGRDFLTKEGIPGGDHSVILTHHLWRELGSDPNVLGKQLHLNSAPYTIVGILAPGVADRLGVELIAPLAFTNEQINHKSHWLLVVGRLRPAVTRHMAQEELNGIAARIARTFPDSNKGWGINVEPLQGDFLPRDRVRNLWLLLGAVGFVLLITCVNIANLLLARGEIRQREIAVRSSVGASRRTIFAQFLTESLLIACLGGALGACLGSGVLRGIVSLVPENILPSEANFALDGHVLLVAMGMTMLSGIIFGCAPAWYASQVDPAETLKSGGGRGATGGRDRKLRGGLIVTELALALALLSGAGLALHSFWKLTRVDTGVRTDHLLTFRLHQPAGRFRTGQEITAYAQQLTRALNGTIGVVTAATVTGMPLEDFGAGVGFSVVGRSSNGDRSLLPDTGLQAVSANYLKAFGIELKEGRRFTESDGATSIRVALVNQVFVDRYLQGLDPLKQRVLMDEILPLGRRLGQPVEWQIVGVTHTVLYGDFRDPGPEFIVPFAQSPLPEFTLGVRTSLDPASMTHTIAAAIHSVDPAVALADLRTMDEVKTEALGEDRFTMRLFAAFAGLALLLAAVGLYGLMNYNVSQRTRELGVRLALGAHRSSITRLVLSEAVQLTTIGLAFGLVGAYGVGRTMQTTLYGVGAMDPLVILAVTLLLFLTAVLAAYLPAWRAGRVDPIEALRND